MGYQVALAPSARRDLRDIVLLQKRRTALFFAAVTGQIEVRNSVARDCPNPIGSRVK
jgi:hypothetical protein